jgi:ribose transport system permease protein
VIGRNLVTDNPTPDATDRPSHADVRNILDQTQNTAIGKLLKSQEFYVAVAILISGFLVSFIAPQFGTAANLGNVLQNFCFTAILAIGMTPILISGGIDLSIGSILGCAGVVLGLTTGAGAPLIVAIPLTIATGTLLGLVNGGFIAYVKLPPFLVTLGTMTIFRSMVLVGSNNKVIYSFGPDEAFLLWLGSGRLFGIPNVFFAVVVCGVLLQFLLTSTRWGRWVMAVGGNERATRLNGLPVKRIKASVYAFGGAMAGVCAVFLVGWLGAVTNSLGNGDELRVIAGAVIGGASLVGGYGTSFGAAIGALLIELIRNALILAGVNPFWQGAFVGGFIIVAVTVQRLRNPTDDD